MGTAHLLAVVLLATAPPATAAETSDGCSDGVCGPEDQVTMLQQGRTVKVRDAEVLKTDIVRQSAPLIAEDGAAAAAFPVHFEDRAPRGGPETSAPRREWSAGHGGALTQRGALMHRVEVIVHGAKGLRDADPSWGQYGSDPHCVVRVGPKGSSWEEKMRGSGRASDTVNNDQNPTWNLGMVALVDPDDAELTVKVFDEDWFDSEFLGEGTVDFNQEAGTIDVPLKPRGTVTVSFAKDSILKEHGVAPSQKYEAKGGQAKLAMANVSEGPGEMLVGVAPLPASLRGIFWLTDQGTSSALASFAGPNHDGGGLSLGYISGKSYNIRVAGDRVWSFANKGAAMSLVELADLEYHFHFDDAADPKFASIGASVFGSSTIKPDMVMKFDMWLIPGGVEEFPGSVVWQRNSTAFGRPVLLQAFAAGGTYQLVQVIDESGKRIEPAYSKFVEYQTTGAGAGDAPGKMFYHAGR